MAAMTKILISTNKGEQLVDAYKHGKFAAQRNIPDSPIAPEDALWNITHVETGLQVTQVWGRAAARKVARMLDGKIAHDVTKEDYERRTDDWVRFKSALRLLVKRD